VPNHPHRRPQPAPFRTLLGAFCVTSCSCLAMAGTAGESPALSQPAAPTSTTRSPAAKPTKLADAGLESARQEALQSIAAAADVADELVQSVPTFFAAVEHDIRSPLAKATSSLNGCIGEDGKPTVTEIDATHTALLVAEQILDQWKGTDAAATPPSEPSESTRLCVSMLTSLKSARATLNEEAALMTSADRAALEARAKAEAEAAAKASDAEKAARAEEGKKKREEEKKAKAERARARSKEREEEKQRNKEIQARKAAARTIVATVYQHWETDKFLNGNLGWQETARRRVRSLYDALMAIGSSPTRSQVDAVRNAFEALDQHLAKVINDGATRPGTDRKMENLRGGFKNLRKRFEATLPKSDRA
jgi:hypothetical protein